MGIDFSHCNASWAYSGFMRFRKRVAKSVGFDLDSMEGFGGKTKWSSLKPDPIHALLNHSDCDGHLTVTECKKVAPRLKEILSSWDDDYDKQMGLELASGMLNAAAEKKPLRFC